MRVLKQFFGGLMWLLREARTFSPMKLYRFIRDLPNRPRLFDIQFESRKKTPERRPDLIDEGTLNVPFSALDNYGLVSSGRLEKKSEEHHENKPTLKEKIKLTFSLPEKPAAVEEPTPVEVEEPVDEGTTLQETFLRQAIKSTDHPNPDFPFLDCPDFHYRLTIVGVRNGHMHVLAKNALGKTFKATVHDVFDAKGRLKVKGLDVRLPLRASHGTDAPLYRKVGTIDLTSYVGLTAHTLAQLEDALNEGFATLRKRETEPEKPVVVPEPAKKTISTLSVLKNIRSLLSRQKEQDRRTYVDRRAGDDRRLFDERRDGPERRSGIDRRKAREEKVMSVMLVKDEEYRKKERRDGNERRSEQERRQSTERRKSTERREELHALVTRSQYIHNEEQDILALINDTWNSTEKVEGEEMVLNPRGDLAMTHLFLDNPGGRLGIQGEKGKMKETFIVPLVNIPTIVRTTTDVTLHVTATSKGYLRFKPKKKTNAAIIIVAPQAMLLSALVEISALGRRKLTLGLLTIEVSKLHKECVLMTPEGKQFMLNSSEDAEAMSAVLRSGNSAKTA